MIIIHANLHILTIAQMMSSRGYWAANQERFIINVGLCVRVRRRCS